MPDLQILMPLYNKAQFVEAALLSVLNQRTSFSYEIIVSDDASTDESASIVERIAGQHPGKVRFYQSKTNRGCLGNTISCYEKTKSRYFTVLDPDDQWIDESHIDYALSFMEKNTQFTIYASNTLVEERGERRPYISGPSRGFDFHELHKSVGGHTSATFFRNNGALGSCLDTLRSKLGTPQERLYEGDSFRTLLHLAHGEGYYDARPRSLYRLTDNGIWAGQPRFVSNSINTQFYLEMFRFFGEQKPEFFLDQAERYGNYTLSTIDIDATDAAPAEQERFSKTYLSIIQHKNRLLGPDAVQVFMFYLPSKTLGGYETLFARIARALSVDLGFAVYFVDYQDGVPRSLLADSRVRMIDYHEGMPELRLGRPYTIVVPTTLGLELPSIVDTDVRMLSWWAHPKSFEWLCWRAKVSPEQAKEHIDMLDASKALMFMDWACWKAAETAASGNFTKNYVPVFAPPKAGSRAGGLHHPGTINAAWLGRLDDDKAPTIEGLIDNLLPIAGTLPVRLHLIGDGNARSRLETRAATLPFEVVFLGTLLSDELDAYLVQNADILFAMGISTLEGANLKIPTVFTFFSTERVEFDAYVWLYEMKDFTLGLYYADASDAQLRVRTLSEILSHIVVPNAVERFGEQCFEYSSLKHSEASVLCRFLNTSSAAGPNINVTVKPVLSGPDRDPPYDPNSHFDTNPVLAHPITATPVSLNGFEIENGPGRDEDTSSREKPGEASRSPFSKMFWRLAGRLIGR